MKSTLEKYLDTVDKCLKPIPISERVDIVKEIKGSILEMERENLSTEQILDRLGNPKDLAKAYLGDLLSKESGFSWNRFLTVCAFYSLVGFSGIFVIPTLAISAPTFIAFGIFIPLAGIIKLADFLLSLNISFVEHLVFQFGSIILSPVPSFIVAIITGTILILIGKGSWKLLVYYCKQVSKTKSKLSI
ncbi:MAG: HAAS signaling domain-containing protein [Clostridium paraputrificum]